MWCEVAIAMLCYNAKLQTEINKRLGKKNYKHDTLTIGGKRGGGGKGEGGGYCGFPRYFSANELPRKGGGG